MRNESAAVLCSSRLASSADASGMITRDCFKISAFSMSRSVADSLSAFLKGKLFRRTRTRLRRPSVHLTSPNQRRNLTSLRDSFDLTVRLIGAEMGLPQRGRTHGGSTIAECHISIDS